MILLIVSVLVLPMFVSNPGVRINPITHTVFKISAEDDFAIVLDGVTESWYVELTGKEREKAMDIINDTISFLCLNEKSSSFVHTPIYYPKGGNTL